MVGFDNGVECISDGKFNSFLSLFNEDFPALPITGFTKQGSVQDDDDDDIEDDV